jgi:SOS-response transcriptional repressor LexA
MEPADEKKVLSDMQIDRMFDLRHLTDRQDEVFRFILRFRWSQGEYPTFREIMKRFDFSSPNAVSFFVSSLTRKNMISKANGHRGIRITGLREFLTGPKLENTMSAFEEEYTRLMNAGKLPDASEVATPDGADGAGPPAPAADGQDPVR